MKPYALQIKVVKKEPTNQECPALRHGTVIQIAHGRKCEAGLQLLSRKHVLDEKLLQALVCVVDEQLLQRVDSHDLETFARCSEICSDI